MADGLGRLGQRRDVLLERLTSLRSWDRTAELGLEELEARRRQLFVVSAFAACGTALIAAASLLWDGVVVPHWVAYLLLVVTGVFVYDASSQERALREITKTAIAERTRARDLERRLDDLTALQAITRRVNVVLLPEEIYQVVLDGAVELLDAVRGSIRLRVDDRLTVAASKGAGVPPIGETVSLLDDVVSPVVSLGLTMREDDPPRLAVPVLVGDRIVGVLEVERAPGAEEFNDRTELISRLFADEAATAFVNANRFDHERTRADIAMSTIEQRSDAVADTVHDLRAPLAGVVGFAQLLRDRYDVMDEDRRRDAAGDVYAQAQVLDARIDGMFRAATAEARATKVREEVPLLDVVLSAIATVRASADKHAWPHRIRLDVSGHVDVVGDPEGLFRVVTNLVGNAVEHAGPDVLVRLQRRGGEVRLHVADRGGGIPTERLGELFSRRPTTDGRGRGLSIVDTLVRAMGGRVGVRTQPGVGSVFTVMLPPAG